MEKGCRMLFVRCSMMKLDHFKKRPYSLCFAKGLTLFVLHSRFLISISGDNLGE